MEASLFCNGKDYKKFKTNQLIVYHYGMNPANLMGFN